MGASKTKRILFLSKKYTPQLEVEDLDFKKLGRVAKVKFNEQQKKRILDILNICRRDSTSWEQGAGGDEARKHMNKVAKAANKLINLLSCVTTKDHAILDHYWPRNGISPFQFQIALAELAGITKAAADDISTGPGNPGNPHIYTLVRRLHYIWTQAGGKGRCSYSVPDDGYSGAFFFFMREMKC